MESIEDINKKLVKIWKEIFPNQKYKINNNKKFFDLGGDSLSLTHMLINVNKCFNVNITLPRFFILPTMAGLAKEIYIQKANKKSGSFNLYDSLFQAQHETELNDALQDSHLSILINKARYTTNRGNIKKILLTGGTGFLGIHLLDQLLINTKATIYCLVKAGSNEFAKSKFLSRLKYYNLQHLNSKRIRLVRGDLSKPNLGLSNKNYDILCKDIDCIYHCGANVHHIYHYEKLRETNSISTLELIRLASIIKKKIIHYISSISCISSFDEQGYGCEGEPKELPPSHFSGYVLSKWVSERLIQQVQQQGHDAIIYRPGNITGHSKTGICFPDFNHFLLFVKGCIQMKAAPMLKMEIEMTPVDILSKSIITISLQKKSKINIFNLQNPKSISYVDYFTYLKNKGVYVKLLSYNEWRNNYLLKINEDNALFPLVPLYNEKEIYYSKCHCDKSQKALCNLGVLYPTNYNQMIDVYYNFLKKINFY